MVKIVEEFDAVAIRNASIQFYEDGAYTPGTKFGCIGTLSGETEMREISKRCEGIVVKKRAKPVQMNYTVSAHIPVQVARDIFGLTSTDLKPGVWAYGSLSQGKRFILTADVIDEFEDIVKLIAIANATNASGFRISIENAQDELAELEIEVTSLPDASGNFYYEALVEELEDPTIADDWHTSFNPALVEAVPLP